MNPQHLSDEAVAAFADGVLTGLARTRATRHTSECAECATAVRVQREAATVLRTAPAPALPTGLLDRLRGLPDVTPISTLPTALAPDGSTVLSTLAPVAALAPSPRSRPANPGHRPRPMLTTAAFIALAGALAAGSAAAGHDDPPARTGTGHVVRDTRPLDRGPGAGMPDPVFTNVSLFHRVGN